MEAVVDTHQQGVQDLHGVRLFVHLEHRVVVHRYYLVLQGDCGDLLAVELGFGGVSLEYLAEDTGQAGMKMQAR